MTREQLITWPMLAGVALLAGCVGEIERERVARVTGRVPANWPAEIPGPVAAPWSGPPPGGSAVNVELHLEGRDEPARVVGQYERADSLAGTPARVWFIWTAEPRDLGKRVEIVFRTAEQGEERAPAYNTRLERPLMHVSDDRGAQILNYWYGDPDPSLPLPLNNYIHPLIGLDGEILSDCRPADHIHHRGLYWAWVRHVIEGQEVGNWWAARGIHLQPRVVAMHDGPVFSSFAARHHWICTKDGVTQPFMDEMVFGRVYKTLPQGRAMDVELVLSAMVEEVRIGGTLDLNKGYGGFTLRFAKASQPLIMTETGLVEHPAANQWRANWVDWSGLFSRPGPAGTKNRSGVAIMVHPDHPDRRPEWITRAYGLINVSYPGLDLLDMPVDEPLQLRYRVWIHRGDAAEGKVPEQYAVYTADWEWSLADEP